jgi:cysteine desulfurase family protein (TIGR01976 family)
MPEPVLVAMAEYVRHGMANRNGAFVTSRETEDLIGSARQDVQAFLKAEQSVIVFGQNMTSLAFDLAASLGRDWRPGAAARSVVVSEIDHHANVDGWRSVAEDSGLEVRWLPVDEELIALDLSQLDRIIEPGCAVVAVAVASNAVGTIQDVRRIADRAHEVGAIVVADAVHAAPYEPIDMEALGADVLFCSAYKFFGPHIGIMAIREELLDRVRPHKVAPAPNSGPGKLERGSQNHEAVAGVVATIGFLTALGTGFDTRARLVATMESIRFYDNDLAERLCRGLEAIPGVRIYRAPGEVRKTPTVAFTVDEMTPLQMATACGREGVFLTHGDFYATSLARRLRLDQKGGWVRAGIAPYITADQIDRALEVVRKVSAEPAR